MEKNNKTVIILLIIIIAILSALCVLFATGTITFKPTDTEVNNPNQSTDNNSETKNIKNYNLLSDNAKKAFSEYARVCIDIIYGDTGVKIKDKLYLSREDLNELTEARINAFKQKTDGKIKLLDYEKAYVKNINGIDCIYFKYNSKYENNPMAVNEEYLFFNGDRCYQISILYRSTQKDIWTSESNDIRQTIKTIKFL